MIEARNAVDAAGVRLMELLRTAADKDDAEAGKP